MDIDSTLKALPLNEEDAVRIVNEIIRIHVKDGISFEIVKAAEIMADFDIREFGWCWKPDLTV